VQLFWPAQDAPAIDWPEIAASMAKERAALCIVNTRKASRDLFQALRKLDKAEPQHLSTTMCPAHRLEVLDSVRDRLEQGRRCHLVSTQLIECGCDVDFPMVFREMAPLEAIVQAAGRCNREGLLNGADGSPGGRVIVFRSQDGRLPPDCWYHAGRATLEQDFLALGREPDIGSPSDLQEYFRRLYHTGELDTHQIQEDRLKLRFASAAEKYRLIDDDTTPVVVVTWQEKQSEIEKLLKKARQNPSKPFFAQLSKYQVNLRNYELTEAGGQVISDPCGVKLWIGTYDSKLGLSIAGEVGTWLV
jgi:CRISPR-associated endonuclease/helicase Cas3